MSEDSRTIVVGVDGSEQSAHALRWALAERDVRGAELDVVYAEHPGAERLSEPVDAGAPVTVRVVEGLPVPVLLTAAKDASLLVVGTRGRSAFGAVVLGSVSLQCAHHTPCPIAVVPEHAPLPGSADEIVVGVDGSAGSARALSWALAEAVEREAPLCVVHAWFTPYAVPPAGIAVVPKERETFLAESRRLLDEMLDAALVDGPGKPDHIERVSIEQIAGPALVNRSKDAGALVVGTRGRGGFAGLLLGSVSHQCLHHSATTVVLVP